MHRRQIMRGCGCHLLLARRLVEYKAFLYFRGVIKMKNKIPLKRFLNAKTLMTKRPPHDQIISHDQTISHDGGDGDNDVFEDAEDSEDDLESYSPPNSPSHGDRLLGFLGQAIPSKISGFANRAWNYSEGSIGDKILKQEVKCRRLKEIERHVDSELREAKRILTKTEARWKDHEGRIESIFEAAKKKIHELEQRKEEVKAAADTQVEELNSRLKGLKTELHEQQHAVGVKEGRVAKVQRAFERCREEIDTITVQHNAHHAHMAALEAAGRAAAEASKARRKAGIV